MKFIKEKRRFESQDKTLFYHPTTHEAIYIPHAHAPEFKMMCLDPRVVQALPANVLLNTFPLDPGRRRAIAMLKRRLASTPEPYKPLVTEIWCPAGLECWETSLTLLESMIQDRFWNESTKNVIQRSMDVIQMILSLPQVSQRH